MSPANEDVLFLEPETHVYYDSEGRIVPGCTSVIGDLVGFFGVAKHVIDHARERGLATHAATALLDVDDLDPDYHDDEVTPRLEGWQNFKDDTGFEVELLDGIPQIEVSRMHGHYRYACTKDRSGFITFGKKRRLILLEIKATAQHSPVTGVQLAAQFEAENRFRKTYGWPLLEGRFSVRLHPALKRGYQLASEYTAKDDFAVFLAQLTRHNWRLNHEKTYRKIYHEQFTGEQLVPVQVEAI